MTRQSVPCTCAVHTSLHPSEFRPLPHLLLVTRSQPAILFQLRLHKRLAEVELEQNGSLATRNYFIASLHSNCTITLTSLPCHLHLVLLASHSVPPSVCSIRIASCTRDSISISTCRTVALPVLLVWDPETSVYYTYQEVSQSMSLHPPSLLPARQSTHVHCA